MSIEEIEEEAEEIIRKAEEEADEIIRKAEEEAGKWRSMKVENPLSEEEIEQVKKEFAELIAKAQEKHKKQLERITSLFKERKEGLVKELVDLVSGVGS